MKTLTRPQTVAKLEKISPKALPLTDAANIALTIAPDGLLKFEDYDVTDRAYQLLCSMAGIPSTYAAKTPVELMLPHLRYWLPASKYNQLKPVAADNSVIGFVRPRAPVMSPLDMLCVIEDCVGKIDELEYNFVSGDVEYLTFTVLGPRVDDRRPEDLVQGGVTLAYSVIDAAPTEVAASTYRLVCTNGLMSSDIHFRASRKLEQPDLLDWLTKAATTAWASVAQEFDAMDRSRGVLLQDHLGLSIESIYSEYAVPLAARDEINEELIAQETNTLFDVINAITKVGSNSQEIIEDPRLMLRVLGVGGQLARHAELCPTCHRVKA